MKSRFIVFGVFALMIVLVSSGYIQQSAEQLYQSGIYKEEVEGELEKAIEIYERIIKDFPENESIAAKALQHIGLCYEKLGNQEAQKAYQRLIDEYPGQKQEVAMAKERLVRLTEAKEKIPHKPNFRKIQIPSQPGNGVLSPNGKELAFVSEGNIWIVPVPGKVSPNIAGEPIKLPGAERARGFGLSWSADGRFPAINKKQKVR